ncbi:MAG: hypothetical protein ACE5E0_03460 [Terriglobia bacterium]
MGKIRDHCAKNKDEFFVVSLHAGNQRTTTQAGVFGFELPEAFQIDKVICYARASGGTSPTLTVDVQEAGSTILDSPIAVTAGSVSTGTPSGSNNKIAANADVTVDFTIGGTTPTWDDVTVTLVCSRQ